MGEITRHVSAWDGLPLLVREWHDGDRRAPLLCLPGLVRTGGDFAALAPLVGTGRRVVAIDYAGRGGSGRAAKVERYAPEACVRDVLDACAALHLHGVVVIGTSFGGLLACALAAARPGLLRAVVINDVGPEVGTAGADFVRTFVGLDPALESLDACVAFLRARLPPLSLTTERRMAGNGDTHLCAWSGWPVSSAMGYQNRAIADRADTRFMAAVRGREPSAAAAGLGGS